MKRSMMRGVAVVLAVLAAGGIYVARSRPKPAKPRVYVTNEEDGTVTVIDGVTDAVVTTIPVGKRPRGIQLSHDGTRAYVALSGTPRAGPNQKDDDADRAADHSADGIGIIDTTTNKLLRVVVSGTDPEQFTVGNGDQTLYVANEDAAEVSVIDIASNRITHAIPVGKEPEGVTLGPGGQTVWATSESDGKVYVIDVSTNAVTATLDVGTARPRAVAFSHRGDRAYVSLENAGAVAIVDVAKRQVESTVKLSGANVRPMGVAFAPDDETVYVTTGRGHVVLVLEAKTGAVRSRLEVGERPWGVGLTHDGTKVYTANGTSNDVSVIDVTKNQVVGTIKVGVRPWGVAVYP